LPVAGEGGCRRKVMRPCRRRELEVRSTG
jgi:hypothetical protein